MNIFEKLQAVFFIILPILLYGKKSKGSQNSETAIKSYSAGGQYVMVTFDGGPHYEITPKVLDILKTKNAKATFFVQGIKAVRKQNILERIISEGHEIGIAGWNLESFKAMSLEKLSSQLQKSIHVMPSSQNITTMHVRGKPTKSHLAHIRPPYGDTDDTINNYILEHHQMEVILWSIDSNDLSGFPSEEIVAKIMQKVQPGDIILCHDITEQILGYLPLLIDSLHSKSYEMLTVQNMRSFPDDAPH